MAKRSLIVLFILAVLCVSGTFAGGKGEEATQPKEAGKTITFTTWNLIDRQEWWQGDFQDFEKANPGFEMIPLVIPYEQYWDKIITLIAAGSPPDVVGEVASYLRVFIDTGQVTPLDDLIDVEVVKKDYYPSEVIEKDGNIYGLCFGGRTMQLLYNKNMLNAAGVKPPTTHDELLDVSQKLTDASKDVYGYAVQTNVANYDDTYESIAMHVRSFNGHFSKGGNPTATDSKTIQGMEYFKKLADMKVTPVNVKKSVIRELFYAEKLAMWIDGPWMVSRFEKNNPGAAGAIWAADNPWENKVAPGGAHYFFIVPTKASNKLGAAMYLKHTMNSDWHQRWVVHTGTPGGRKDGVPADYLKDNPWFQVYLTGMEKYGFSVTPEGFEENAIIFMKIVNNYLGQVLYENAPVQDAMKGLQKELEELKKEMGK